MLKKTLLVLILSCVSFTFAAEQPSSPHHYKVIIIGAGVAGLEAAHYLQEHGIKDFIILEARDHIGGRAATANLWNNTDIALGATWIEGGIAQNPIMKLVNDWKIEVQPANYEKTSLYAPDGKEVPDTTDQQYDALYNQFKTALLEKKKDITKNANLSISDVAVEFIQSHHLDQKSQASFIFKLSDKIEEEYAADITNLSALWFDNDETMPGTDMFLIHGYKDIMNGIAKDMDKQILLKHIVKKVDYQDKTTVVVTTTDGQQFNGQYVICTLPLGVLKKGSVEFNPQLPAEKLAAVNHMNMGVMNKIIMKFPSNFWDTEEYIDYIAPAYWSGKNWVKKGEWIQFYNMDPFVHQPILFALVAGDFAQNLENVSDEETIKNAMQTLKVIYGNEIPNPSAYVITRWGKDPFSEGSYSSLRPGALNDGADYINMAKPVADRVFFAGEATNVKYPSTVYGAYLTGNRAAQEVINHTTDKPL
jgi:monoamine oxidase